MKKLIFLLIACCMVFAGCGETKGTQSGDENKGTKTSEPQKTGTIKKDVADFCSNVETVSSCASIILADPNQETESGDLYLGKAKEIYEEKIKDVEYDSVHINDIKEMSYIILKECESVWNDTKEGKIGTEDYDIFNEKQENISSMCIELKSYLE